MIRKLSLALATFFALATSAFAANSLPYEPGLIQSLLKDGKTVFVDYKATWCSTCATQERVVDQLRAENSAYDASMTFVTVDWDTYAEHDVTTSRNIPRRSTLLVLKKDQELGRIVAGTSSTEIKTLLDKGL